MFRWLHYVGVALLFLSAILLLVTTISSPVIGDIAILKVLLTNQTDIRHSSVTFGSFGHCILDVPPDNTDQDFCFPKVIGYKPAVIMSEIDGRTFNTADAATVDGLTNAFVLHPVACALAFIAAFAALGGVVGSLVGTLIAVLAWIITLVVMAIDFAVFGIIKDHVNSDSSGSNAYYSYGMWTCLAAMILLLLGTIIVFFTCCTERRKKKSGSYTETKRSSRRGWRGSRRSHDSNRVAYDDNRYRNNGYRT